MPRRLSIDSSTGYVYDGDGQRVQKIVCAAGTNPCTATTPNAVTTTYVYDAFGNPPAPVLSAHKKGG